MSLDISHLILPGNCLLCRRASLRNLDLCLECEQDLPLLEDACWTCAMPLTAPVKGEDKCGECLKHPPPQGKALAAFRYDYPLDHLVQNFKFNGDQAAGRLLGQLFAKHVSLVAGEKPVLLPVPLHVKRLRERGYNQALLLAQSIREQQGFEVNDKLLQRVRATEVQSNMSASARRSNVRNAFSLRSEKLPPHVAIVDDVVTTGSTTREIAMLLRKSGVKKIEVWALARTPDWH